MDTKRFPIPLNGFRIIVEISVLRLLQNTNEKIAKKKMQLKNGKGTYTVLYLHSTIVSHQTSDERNETNLLLLRSHYDELVQMKVTLYFVSFLHFVRFVSFACSDLSEKVS